MTEWPVALRGVTESVVTTLGPNDRWNAAALGIRASPRDADRANADGVSHAPGDAEGVIDTPATATTWGNTRTRRNFHRQGEGVVQFVSDPVVFVDAALSIHETDDPVLDAADAWARVDVEFEGRDEDGGTRREHWTLQPVASEVVRTSPATVNRGFNAVIEATVAASRLDVDAYDEATLWDRLDYFADVAETCGGPREREAMARVLASVEE